MISTDPTRPSCRIRVLWATFLIAGGFVQTSAAKQESLEPSTAVEQLIQWSAIAETLAPDDCLDHWIDWETHLQEGLIEGAWSEHSPADQRELGQQAYHLLKVVDRLVVRSGQLDTEEQFTFQEIAISAARTAENEEWVLYRFFRLARLHQESGDLEHAIRLLEDAINACPAAPNTLALAFLTLAEFRAQCGQYQEALAALDSCEQYKHQGTGPRVALSLPAQRAGILLKQGLPDKAREFIDKSLQLASRLRSEGLDASTVVVTAYLRNVEHALAVGQFRAVDKIVEEYLADRRLFRAEPRAAMTLRTLLATAWMARVEEEPSLRERGVRQCQDVLASPNSYAADRWKCYVLLTDDALSQGDWEEASQHLETLETSIPESSRTLAQKLEADCLAARVTLESPAPVAQLPVIEARLEDRMDELWSSWNAARLSQEEVGFLLYREARALVSQLFRVSKARSGDEGVWRALQHLLRIDSLGSVFAELQAVIPQEPRDAIASLVDQKRGLLMFPPGDRVTHVVAVDDRGIAHEELESYRALRDLTGAYLQCLFRPATDSNRHQAATEDRERQLAREIGQRVLPATIQEKLKSWSHVQVVGTGFFHSIPLEWLILEDDSRVGLTRSVHYLPSATLAPRLDERARDWRHQDVDRHCLLIGGSRPSSQILSFATGLRQLSIEKPTADNLLGSYPSDRIAAILNESATEPALQAMEGSATRVLQFLGHSVWDGNRPGAPLGLVLAPTDQTDGVLWAPEIATLPQASFAMLTSCRSGSGRERRGDHHAADLAGAWLAKGTPTVLVTKADLRYDVAVELSQSLHESLRAGLPPAIALQDVRRDFWNKYGGQAPLLLGMVRIVGAGLEPVFPLHERSSPNTNQAWWLLVFAGFLTMAFVWTKRGKLTKPKATPPGS